MVENFLVYFAALPEVTRCFYACACVLKMHPHGLFIQSCSDYLTKKKYGFKTGTLVSNPEIKTETVSPGLKNKSKTDYIPKNRNLVTYICTTLGLPAHEDFVIVTEAFSRLSHIWETYDSENFGNSFADEK